MLPMTSLNTSSLPRSGGTVQHTRDGRYIVVRGRLWRAANPGLPADELLRLKAELGAARAAVRVALESGEGLAASRGRVNTAKVALGERGPVWWTDGAPDLNSHLVRNTPYRDQFSGD